MFDWDFRDSEPRVMSNLKYIVGIYYIVCYKLTYKLSNL